MPSTYSPNLRIELIASGEQANTWGNTTNTNLGTLIEQAIAGLSSIDVTAGNVTLTAYNGASDQSRQMILNVTGTPGVARTLTAPSVSKVYVIANNSNADVTIETATGTGVTVSSGYSKFVFCDGTDFSDVTTETTVLAVEDLIVNGDATLGDALTDVITINGTVQPGVVISGSSSSAALRITQTGAGNALLVEDSANPDSTPFVVDNSGYVIAGHTTRLSSSALGFALTETIGTDNQSAQSAIWRFSNDSDRPRLTLYKSRSGTIGTNTIVASGDSVGEINFLAADGANYIQTAAITAVVDGTPGTNDMPGRLVFSTTADGASSPTERMRINNAGNVLVGRTFVSGGERLGIGGNTSSISTTTSAVGILNDTTVSSAQTTAYTGYNTFLSTIAASFTLAGLRHFSAFQSTIGAGSTVTNQYGFFVDASLTGATNNYGFYSNIASGTGRYNFYAAGTADNYFAGSVGIGTAATSGRKLQSAITSMSVTNPTGVYVNGNADATATSLTSFSSFVGQDAGSSIGAVSHFSATQSTFSGTVSAQYGYLVSSTLTGATNNYGFYSNIASGSGRYNFYAAGTADNYFEGRIGLGGAQSADGIAATIYNKRNITGSSFASAYYTNAAIQSDVTNGATYFETAVRTQAAAFTLSNLRHFVAAQGTFGAGSTITNQYGYSVDASLTGATNNYGFYSNIAAGSGRYNFYAAGTADNYFAGNVGIGVTPNAGRHLVIGSNITGSTTSLAVFANGAIQSDVTASARYFQSSSNTAAATFTTSEILHFYANQGTFGAGSTVSNQMGFSVATTLTGATSNYGFYSAIASGSGRYNFYAAGTADNYFAGLVLSNSSIKSNSATAGIGYGTGAGGTVTQTISRTTGVTLNKICGSVTLFSASATVAANFTVTNSTVSATDTILCSVQASGATEIYQATSYAVANGSFKIYMASPGTATEAPTINFTVIKSVTA